MIGLDYIAIGRKILMVDELPIGALYEKQIISTQTLLEKMNLDCEIEVVEYRQVDRFTDFLKSEDDW